MAAFAILKIRLPKTNNSLRIKNIVSPERATEKNLRATEKIRYCSVFLFFSVALCGLNSS